MGLTLAQKIIKSHLVSGEMTVGSEIALRIDQTLTQDATGTMAYLEFETMGIDRVRTERSVAYIDHNTLQSGFENADDHRFIQSIAKKYGIYFSRPGNGICHQVHLERFGIPGKTLIGSDSHTPTGGGIGMLAFGAGGLDVAVAMGGGAYYITMPKMIKVNLTGKLRPFVTAKDVSLEILRILSVKGGVGAIIEWGGEGVKTLATYQEDYEYLGGYAAITETKVGKGRIILMGAQLSVADYRKFIKNIALECGIEPICEGGDTVEVNILEGKYGTVFTAIECSGNGGNVKIPFDCTNIDTGEKYEKNQNLSMHGFMCIFAKKN